MPVLLIVDDSAVDRRLVGGLLEKEHEWTLEFASDGDEALERCKAQPPDLVLTDLQMPKMNGLDLVASLRRELPKVPVLLMTAKGSEEIAVEALQAGAASYVPKRGLSLSLVETVRRVLSASQDDRNHSAVMRRMQFRQEEFLLENDVSLLLTLSRYLQNSLGEVWEMERADRMRIGTALEEALLNAMYHGNLEVSSKLKEVDHRSFYELAERRRHEAPYQNRKVRVEIETTARFVRYVIADEGPGFNPNDIPDPTDPENLDRPCGRGLLLMKAFMSEVEYNSTGNQVIMTRHRFAH